MNDAEILGIAAAMAERRLEAADLVAAENRARDSVTIAVAKRRLEEIRAEDAEAQQRLVVLCPETVTAWLARAEAMIGALRRYATTAGKANMIARMLADEAAKIERHGSPPAG